MISILFLMILCHIIDDFVLQGTCLVNLKQKEWWNQHCHGKLYEHDYLMGLTMHCLSWSIMIHLPLMLLYTHNDWIIAISILVNAAIHFIVDDLKANKFKINLITDQTIHLVQIILTYIILVIIL